MGRLRDLLRGVQCPAIKGVDEGSEIPMSAQAAEAAARLLERGGDPADKHVAIAPATDVAGEATDEAIEVLDRVRAPQRAVEGAGDAQALEREGLVEAFAQGCGCAGVRAFEAGGELFETALGKRRIGEPIRLVEDPSYARAQGLGEMFEDVAPLGGGGQGLSAAVWLA